MTDPNPFTLDLTPTSRPSPDYPWCPLTDGHTDFHLDIDDGTIRLTCLATTCGRTVEPDLLDGFSTGSEIPVTVEFFSDPGDGREREPDSHGTITPRDEAQQLRAERDIWKERARNLQNERDQLAEKLAAATNAVAKTATQRNEARILGRALWAALCTLTEGYGDVLGYDPPSGRGRPPSVPAYARARRT